MGKIINNFLTNLLIESFLIIWCVIFILFFQEVFIDGIKYLYIRYLDFEDNIKQLRSECINAKKVRRNKNNSTER